MLANIILNHKVAKNFESQLLVSAFNYNLYEYILARRQFNLFLTMSDIKTNNLDERSRNSAILIKDLMVKWESNKNRLLVFEKYLKFFDRFNGCHRIKRMFLKQHGAQIKFRYEKIAHLFLEYDEIQTKIELWTYSNCFTIQEQGNSITKHADFSEKDILLLKEREEIEDLLNRVKVRAEQYLRIAQAK